MSCLACELIEHPDRVPGGRIASMGTWVVEHCIGPLGIGTVVVKPIRHVIHLADLDESEAAEMGPVLRTVARAVSMASTENGDPPGQVYACLWSHAQREPSHIHFVVQPVGAVAMARHDAHGPELQVRMFNADEPMDPSLMIAAAERIRAHLGAASGDVREPLSMFERTAADLKAEAEKHASARPRSGSEGSRG